MQAEPGAPVLFLYQNQSAFINVVFIPAFSSNRTPQSRDRANASPKETEAPNGSHRIN